MSDAWKSRFHTWRDGRAEGGPMPGAHAAAKSPHVGYRGCLPHFALPGKPDFAFPKRKLAVFVDGCFWHGCAEHCRMPKSNRAFWKAKITRNQARDREVGRLLRQRGYAVVRVWAHALSHDAKVAARIRRRLDARG